MSWRSQAARPVRSRQAALDERGSVTAEFAIVVPAVLLLVAGVVSTLSTAMEAIRLQDAAGVVARAAGRGDAGAAGLATRLVPRASLSLADGELVCATLTEVASFGGLASVVPLAATSCAASEGR